MTTQKKPKPPNKHISRLITGFVPMIPIAFIMLLFKPNVQSCAVFNYSQVIISALIIASVSYLLGFAIVIIASVSYLLGFAIVIIASVSYLLGFAIEYLKKEKYK